MSCVLEINTMKYFCWKSHQKAALCCVFVFVVWELYYVFHLSTSERGSVIDNLFRSVVSRDFKVKEIQNAAGRVTSRPLNTTNPDEVLTVIKDLNDKQYIRNGYRVGLRLDKDSVVILVQVHNRLTELKYLIKSMERARYIGKCLVIFSHDVYSHDINDAVQSILSFPVLQIYYPYSVQTNPTSYPGQDPNDCPRDMDRKRKCNNVKFPDSYGHYREAKVSQMKLHWLWQLYYVMEEVKILKEFAGTFLRVDEDYYFSEDAIHVLQEMNKIRTQTGHYKVMVLGDSDEIPTGSFKGLANMIRRRKWHVGVGRGMAFGRKFWEELKACSHVFCTHDDYNWDWSLQESVKQCLGGNLDILQPSVGRVFHAGLCHGFHRHYPECSTKYVIQRIDDLLIENEEFLFPKVMYITEHLPLVISVHRMVINGGWADPRDHKLCKSILDSKGLIEETIRSINNQETV